MQTDRETLDLVAARLCVDNIAAPASGPSSGGFGTIGSFARAVSADQDRRESRGESRLA